MNAISPPEGMSEVDYEAIEAAVTETVRGRWFLNEFARRNRVAESRLLLEAVTRIETAVAARPGLPPPSADPSIRLLIQRVKQVAGQLDELSRAMHEDGVDEVFCEAVEAQARAVAGLMRNGPANEPDRRPAALPAPAPPPRRAEAAHQPPAVDPRLAVFSELDALPLAEKLALFT